MQQRAFVGRLQGYRASAVASYQQARLASGRIRAASHPAVETAEPAPAAAAAADATAPAAAATPITAMDIRIGRIVGQVAKHPDADSLFVETVDVGEPEPRTIVSGLVKYVAADDLADRKVVVLCNLKARNMRGVKSWGMLLCASNADHTAVEPLTPPADAPVGERVWFGEEQQQPAPEPENRVQKKKMWEAVQPDLKTSADRVAGFKGAPMMTSAGPVTAASLAGANIS